LTALRRPISGLGFASSVTDESCLGAQKTRLGSGEGAASIEYRGAAVPTSFGVCGAAPVPPFQNLLILTAFL